MRKALVVLGLVVVCTTGCPFFETNPETGQSPADKASAVAMTVAPALPGPLGGIVAGGATVLTLLGSIFAKRKVEATRASVADPAMAQAKVAGLNPLTKMMAERKWVFPIIAAIIAAGNGANLWHMDPEALYAIIAALGLPAAGEFVKDGMAAKAAA